jgi:non-specific serine/threonine protein kinase
VDTAVIRFGPFRLDRGAGCVWRHDERVPLPPKPFALLQYLAERPGRLITKDELLKAIWPGTFVIDAALKVAIRDIRRALDDSADEPLYIETVHGRGYRFRPEERGTRLPPALTSFVGRDTELAAIVASFATTRLVTLRGVGGCGKTRLARQTAIELGCLADGIWWVDLAGLGRPDMVVPTIAATLGIRDHRERNLSETLGDFVRGRELLLVLDNCEHVLPGCVPIVLSLLAEGPRLKILATSREPLGVAGERVLVVPPLALPDSDAADAIRASDAVRLFVERAQDADPQFECSHANASTVAAICRRLDGLPLAIELVAAHAATFSLDEILSRVSDRLTTLPERAHAASDRHRSLTAVIEWSDALLRTEERELLSRLAVFSGSFSLNALQRITSVANGADVRDVLGALVNKSLVTVISSGPERRYKLLEMVREHANDKLDSSERQRLRERHATFFSQLAAEWRPFLTSYQRHRAIAALTAERDNLRTALDRQLTEAPLGAQSLAASLWWWWFHTNQWREGRQWLEAALAATREGGPARVEALCGAGALAWFQGEHSGAHAHLDEAVRLGRLQDQSHLLVRALDFLGQVIADRGEVERALPVAKEAVAVAEAGGNQWELAIATIGLGNVLLFGKSVEAAERCYMEGASLCRATADPWALGMALRNLGIVSRHRGQLERSLEYLRESLAVLRPEDERSFVSRSLEELSKTLVSTRNGQLAATLFGAAEALRESLGAAILASRYPEYERAVSEARELVGDRRFSDAWIYGRSLARDAAIDLAINPAAYE